MNDPDHGPSQPAAGSPDSPPHSSQPSAPRPHSHSANPGRPDHVRGQWQTGSDHSSIPRIVTHPPLERARRQEQPSQPLGNQPPPRPHDPIHENTPQNYATAGTGSASDQSLNTPRGHSSAAARRQPPPRPRRPDHQEYAGFPTPHGTPHTAPMSRPEPSKIPRPAIESLLQIPRQPSPEVLYRQELYALARARLSSAPPRLPPAPPPSARRGPPTYYPTIAQVTSIPEESETTGHREDSDGHSDADESQPRRSTDAAPATLPGYSAKHARSTVDLVSHPSITGLLDPTGADVNGREQQHEQHSGARGAESPERVGGGELAQSTDNDQGSSITVLSPDRVKRLSIETARQVDIGQPHGEQAGDEVAAPLAEANLQSPASTSVESGDDSPVAVTAPTSLRSKHSGDRLSARTPSSEALAETNSLLSPSFSGIDVAPRSRLSVASGTGSRSISQHNTSRSPSPLGTVVQRQDGASESGPTNSLPAVPLQDQLPLPAPGFSGRQGDSRNRPSHLNADSIRSAEARGSLTSLPDLIRRATKLASNLDRGRTASRLGIHPVGAEDEKRGSDRYSTGLSDIIASFPSPAAATPPLSRAGKVRHSLTNWSTRHRHSELGSASASEAGSAGRKPRTKYCGLTLRNFILLGILLFLLLVAAVVVPVVLIVLPRQRHRTTPDPGNSQLAQCQTTLPCANGGATTYTNGVCGCICINGFTGSRCDSASQQGCTMTSVGSMDNATVGSDIPRIVSNAPRAFGIPLDAQTLLGLFAAADLSCNAENALVTFTNVVQRDLATMPMLERRDDQTSSSKDPAATSNGITKSTPSATSTSSSSSSSTSSSSSSAIASPSATTNSTTTTDFARAAVLYIFQSSGTLAAAIAAQSNLQDSFDNRTSATGAPLQRANLSLADGFTCDLDARQLRWGNGTVVQAGG
nr:hypothetical protein CFP56_20528 [Quercus suber]